MGVTLGRGWGAAMLFLGVVVAASCGGDSEGESSGSGRAGHDGGADASMGSGGSRAGSGGTFSGGASGSAGATGGRGGFSGGSGAGAGGEGASAAGQGGALGGAAGDASAGSAGQGGGSGGSSGSSGSAGSGGVGSECDSAADCADGHSCTVDDCVSGFCQHESTCPATQYCDRVAGCQPIPVCATTAQCVTLFQADACKVNVRCDSVTATCSFDILDGDADGRPPVVCGGTDCDDSRGNVHPGADEICDGRDNDCDTVTDELVTCPLDKQCVSGACRCTGGKTDCLNKCADLQTDVQHCGACFADCALDEQCFAGTCCRPADVCSGRCVDKQTDPRNCGTCGTSCSSTQECRSGSCVAVGGSCNPAFCPGGFGTPCCLGPNGPCGVDFGMGCVNPNNDGGIP